MFWSLVEFGLDFYKPWFCLLNFFASQTYLFTKPVPIFFFNLRNIFLVGSTTSDAQPNLICDLQKTNELSCRAYAAFCPSLVPQVCNILKTKGDALRYSTQGQIFVIKLGNNRQIGHFYHPRYNEWTLCIGLDEASPTAQLGIAQTQLILGQLL